MTNVFVPVTRRRLMSNKPIIIDGVDVSEWKYYIADNGVQYNGCYELTNICECNKEDDFCDDNPNCYYKQLQREKQDSQEARDTAIKEFNRAEKLYQTLTDIRKIAEREVKRAPDGETFARPEIKQILQKISEVEDAS